MCEAYRCVALSQLCALIQSVVFECFAFLTHSRLTLMQQHCDTYMLAAMPFLHAHCHVTCLATETLAVPLKIVPFNLQVNTQLTRALLCAGQHSTCRQ